jgi:hypothetical protein
MSDIIIQKIADSSRYGGLQHPAVETVNKVALASFPVK